MKKIRLLTLLVLGLLIGGTAYAQSQVSGVVRSSEDNQPLPGVTVQIQGTTQGVLTGPDGSYTLNVSQGSSLVFSFAGMARQTIAVGNQSTLNVTMRPDALQTEAVTVTALGGKKQLRKLGYATSTVRGDDLARTNTISPVNALQGKVAGLHISTSGASGLTSSPVITLRGAKSLTKNNSPIFVIDGIVMENAEMALNAAGSNSSTAYGNQLKNLNASDYESITVLKGAAATALYGSRGANGAIVITSKGGKARQGIGVEVTYSHEFSSTYNAPMRLQNTYGMGSPDNTAEGDYLEEYQSTASSFTTRSFGPKMNTGLMMRQYYKQWPDNENPLEPYVSYKDNWKAFFQTGRQDNVNIALTGGSENATYRVSYGYSNTKGALPNNEFKRHSVNVRTNGKINDVFSVDFNMQYSNSNTLNAHIFSGTSGTSYAALVINNLPRSMDLKWYADNYIDFDTWQRMPTELGVGNTFRNNLNRFYDDNVDRNEQTIIASVGLTAQFTDWLDANARISYNDFSQFTETKNWGSGYGRGNSNDQFEPGGGSYGISGSKSGSYNFLAQIHSNNMFVDDNLELDVRLFYELYGNTRSTSYSKSTKGGLIVPGLWTFANSKEALTIEQYSTGMTNRNNMTVGVGAAVNLSWKDQINLELTARNDWVSALLYPSWIANGADNYSVFYPSANLSWVFTDTFDINPSIISYGQLRASFSQVGSGPAAYETAKGAGGYTMVSLPGSTTGSTMYAAQANNTTLPNYDLKPEIQQSIEFGGDIRFLEGRIGLDVAYYKTNTKNQILTLATVKESGVTSRIINAGNIQNQGWELALDFRPIQSRSVRWEIGVNWSRNRSKVKSLHQDIKDYTLFNGGTGGVPAIVAFEGGTFGEFVSGSGYGYTDSGAGVTARYRNLNDPNDPLNGKGLLQLGGTVSGERLYRYVRGPQLDNYYHGILQDDNGNYYNGYNTPGDQEYFYDKLGSVEAKFYAGINTTLSYNIPNGGSVDLFAQIDGRYGGYMVSTKTREAMQYGNIQLTMYGRDAEHGGEARTNYKGETVHNGLVLDGVFIEDQVVTSLKDGTQVDLAGKTMRWAVDQGHIQPMLSTLYYYDSGNFGFWGSQDININKATYFALREITVGYNFPEKWIKHVGLQSARVSFTARNLGYIYNGLRGGINPESLSSNNPLTPIDYGGVPYVRNFSVNLNLRF